MSQLALFDMDDTLVRKNTAQAYFAELYRSKRLGRRQVAHLTWILARYKLNVVDMAALTCDAARQIAGQEEAEMDEVCRLVYLRDVRPHISRPGRQSLEAHQKSGDTCAIITASTQYIARLLAADLGIEHLLCTELEVADGRFTGQIAGGPCFGAAKVERAQALAEQCGATLSTAFFYTDSHSDLPLLNLVGHPRVVRPDPRLRLQAWRRGWPVLLW